MNSKTQEEVRKRRGKPSPSHFNIYQGVVLVGGAITIGLAVWTSPSMASNQWLGVMGATLLIFFLFKYHKRKKEDGKKFEQKEMLARSREKTVDRQDILLKEEEKVTADLEGIFPEEKKVAHLPEKFPKGKKKVVELRETFSEEEEKWVDMQEFPEGAKLANLPEIFHKEGEKVVDLQGGFPGEEEKMIDLQELLLKSEKKEGLLDTDFKMEGKAEKTVKGQ